MPTGSDNWVVVEDQSEGAAARVLCPTLLIGLGALGRRVASSLSRFLYFNDPRSTETTAIICIDGDEPPVRPEDVVEQVRCFLLRPENHVRVELPPKVDEEVITRTEAFEALHSSGALLLEVISREIQRITTRETLQDLQEAGFQIPGHIIDLFIVGSITDPLASASACHVPYVVEHLVEAFAGGRSLNRVAVLALSDPDHTSISEKDYDQAMSWAALAEIHAYTQGSLGAYEKTWADQRISRTMAPYDACYVLDEIDSEGQRLNSSEELGELITQFLALAFDHGLRSSQDNRCFAFRSQPFGMIDHGNQTACFRVFGLSSVRVPKSSEYIWTAIEQGVEFVARGLRGRDIATGQKAAEETGSLENAPTVVPFLDTDTTLDGEVSELERKLGIADGDLDALLSRHWTAVEQQITKDIQAVSRVPVDDLSARMIDAVNQCSQKLSVLPDSVKKSLQILRDRVCMNHDNEATCLTKWWQELVSRRAAGVIRVRRILEALIARQQAAAGARATATASPVRATASADEGAPEEANLAIDETDRGLLSRIGRQRESSVQEVYALPSERRLFWEGILLGGLAVLVPWIVAWQGLLWWFWCALISGLMIPLVYLVWTLCIRARERARDRAIGAWQAVLHRRCRYVWDAIRSEARQGFAASIAVSCTNILDGKVMPLDSKLNEVERVLKQSLSHRHTVCRALEEVTGAPENRSRSPMQLLASEFVPTVESLLKATDLLSDAEKLEPLVCAQRLVGYLGRDSRRQDTDLEILALEPERFDAEAKLTHLILRAKRPFAAVQRLAPQLGTDITWLCTPGDGRLATVPANEPGVIRVRLADRHRAAGLHVITNLIPESLISSRRMRERWVALRERDSNGLRGGFDQVIEVPELSVVCATETDDEKWVT